MTDLDADLKELLIEEARERAKDRHAGHTLARLFDMVREIDERTLKIEAWIIRTEAKHSTAPPPRRHEHLSSLATIDEEDDTSIRRYKAEVAPLVETFRFWSQLKSLAIGVLAAAGIAVGIYSALHK